MRVSSGCRRLLGCEMPHTVCLSPAGYSTESQDRVRIAAAGTSRSAPSPLPTRLGWLALPLAMLVRRLVHREVGTTRYSPAADVPRFRASEPLFFPRHLHRHDDHGLGAMIARFRGRPGLAWAVRDVSRREGFQAPSPLTGSHRLSGPCPHRFFEFPRGTDDPLIKMGWFEVRRTLLSAFWRLRLLRHMQMHGSSNGRPAKIVV